MVGQRGAVAVTRTALAIARARRARRLGLTIEPLLDGDRRLWVSCPACAERNAKRTGTRCPSCWGSGVITAEAMAARRVRAAGARGRAVTTNNGDHVRIDTVHALELIGELRRELEQIPREENARARPRPTFADTLRAQRALRPKVRAIEDLRARLEAPETPGEKVLRDLLLAAVDEAGEAGVSTSRYPGQEENELRVLGLL